MTRHAGLRPWLMQRVSAVYLAIYTVFLLWHFATQPPAGFRAWALWVSSPLIGVGAALFLAALLLHAWIGVRDVLMDYIHPYALRLMLSAIIATAYLACGLWALRVLWQAGYA